MTAQFNFKSVGKTHQDEAGFFKFLVGQKFSEQGSKVLQWCKIEGLTITIDAVSEDIINWGKETIKDGFKTNTGYQYTLIP